MMTTITDEDQIKVAERIVISNKLIDNDIYEIQEITKGFELPQKSISSKYFYDAEGSRLFEKICRLPEYYH